METDADFTIRKACPEDKGAVERLCAKIWEGEDYLPHCFDAWVADQEGELTVCFSGEQLAGISKLTWLAPGEAWLEGLRKDPDLPVKGIGTALCRRYLARLAATPNLHSIRFSTYFANHASIKLNESLGFRHVATATIKELRSETLRERAKTPESASVVPLTDAVSVFSFIRASGCDRGFIHQAWRSFPWSEAFFLKTYLEPGFCHGVVEDGRIRAMAACLIDPTKGEGCLPFFDAEDQASAAVLLGTLESRFASAGAPFASAILPAAATRAIAFLDALGWKSWEREEDYLVYEFPLERLSEYRT